MDKARDRLRVVLLGCTVEAVVGKHDLEPWKTAKGGDVIGFEAECRRCGMVIYTNGMTVLSYLADRCPASDG